MSRIVRPPKTAGTNQFQTEVAANAIAILDTEVDNDFNTIYSLVNGNLDDDNISGSPKKIAYEKLALTGKIQVTDLLPGFQLPGGSVAQDSITTRELAPGAVLLENIGILQATASMVENGDDADFPVTANGPEMLCAEAVWTSRGGWWTAHATIGGFILSGGAVNVVTVRIREGGTAGVATDGTPYQVSRIRTDMTNQPAAIAVPWSVSLIGQNEFGIPGPLTNPHRMKLTVQHAGPTSAVVTVFWKRVLVHETA